ncbi:MAG TPA: alpha/beta hydrolase [Candidatus Acidoferrales bacterium]|nr:alpha/beta hydrolase [Candidatus Acidoferrales bacterium]
MLIIASVSLAAAQQTRPAPCRIPGVEGPALCAAYPVWENRASAAGRRIDLHVVILPALRKDHAPDPLFLLHGGPGAPATEFAAFYSRHPVRDRRDIVMIDQRGTGRSNPLDCDLYGDPPDLRRVMTSQFPVDQVRACRERLEQSADLTQYTTAIAMDDVDEVRQWLGYGRINLWGGSYGTFAAQVYMRRHEPAVRAVVLEAVLPADEPAILHHASAGQRAIDLLIERTRSSYPYLRDDFAAMFELIRRGAEVRVHDRGGRVAAVRPSVEAVFEGIRHRLYTDTGDTLAALVHRAATGDLAPIVQAALDAQIAIDSRLSMGLNLSVTCSEDVPIIVPEMAARETAGTFLGDLRIRDQQAACAQWPRGDVPADLHVPVHSAVPVLLMSGYRDPVTPPAFAERVAAQLPNSLHVVFPDASHGSRGECGRDLMTSFLERGSVRGLDTSCVARRGVSLPLIAAGFATAIAAIVLIRYLRARRHGRA